MSNQGRPGALAQSHGTRSGARADPVKDADKPPILRQPRRLLKLAAVIFVLLLLVYVGTALTGFLRNQEKAPDPRMTGDETPLERAT